MTLTELLADRGLNRALIIDDGYDSQPTSNDLSSDDDAWANFFSDIGADQDRITAAFPSFEGMNASDLKRSDAFVSALWKLKDEINSELWNGLFGRYISDGESDQGYLDKLETALKSLSVDIIRSGRTVPADANSARLIFVDLFLGSGQDDEAMTDSVNLLKTLLSGREENPPVVILMSRSSRLDDKKGDFRDRAHLIGAMFRVIRKQDLLIPALLERTLTRLARHYQDAARIAAFLHSWSAGLDAAKTRFMTTIRRIDLPDYCQIHRLLLTFEGQPIGSYLIDVFDRVLQYEVEADSDTITAAENLNSIDTQQYPPPYILGSADLQDLVFNSIYQNQERLRVTNTVVGKVPVGFGDILGNKSLASVDVELTSENSSVFVLLTPACDLARGEAMRIILLKGTLEELTPAKWTFKGKARTPIFILSNRRRMWIQWDLKDVQMQTPEELNSALGAEGPLRLLARLRVDQALELQQSLLSQFGRVGLVAQLPGTFPVAVEVFYLDTNQEFRRFELPSLEANGGVCFTGKDKDSNPIVTLVLSEKSCDEILDAIAGLAPEEVHDRARDTLSRLKSSRTFPIMLEQGLRAPRPDQLAILQVNVPSLDDDGNLSSEIVGIICRHPMPEPIGANFLKLGALFIVIKEIA